MYKPTHQYDNPQILSSNLFAAARKKLLHDQSFCLVRFPGEDEVFLYHRASSHPVSNHYFVVKGWNKNDDSFYLSPFDESEENSFLETTENPTLPAETTFEDYSRQFYDFQNAFENTVVKKAILSRLKHIATPPSFDAVSFFDRLNKAYPDALVYLLALPGYGVWAGATPEILIAEKNQNWTAVSLAGTQKRATSPYQWGEKEREEHEFVSEHIRHTLKDMQLTNYLETGPFTVEAGSVAHLKTVFEFNSPREKFDYQKYVDLVHPTPAISGAPLEESVALINQTESHRRNLYTGYLGRVNKESIDLYVNLRCAQIFSNTLVLYIGGGITRQSVLDAEWQETEEKAKTLLKHIYE